MPICQYANQNAHMQIKMLIPNHRFCSWLNEPFTFIILEWRLLNEKKNCTKQSIKWEDGFNCIIRRDNAEELSKNNRNTIIWRLTRNWSIRLTKLSQYGLLLCTSICEELHSKYPFKKIPKINQPQSTNYSVDNKLVNANSVNPWIRTIIIKKYLRNKILGKKKDYKSN